MKPDKSGIDLNNVKMSMNPFCEVPIRSVVSFSGASFFCQVDVAQTVGNLGN